MEVFEGLERCIACARLHNSTALHSMPDKSIDNVNVVTRRTRQTTSHMYTRRRYVHGLAHAHANHLYREFSINNGHMVL
jgi:hypothetical protein